MGPCQPSGSPARPACGNPPTREPTRSSAHLPGTPCVLWSRGRVFFSVLETLPLDSLWLCLPLHPRCVRHRPCETCRDAWSRVPFPRPLLPSARRLVSGSRERSSVQSCSSVTRPPAPSVLQVQKFLPMPPFWATFSISLGRANISRVFLRTLRVRVSQVTYSAGSVNRSCLPHWVVSLWSGCLSSNVSRGGDAVSAGHSLCPVCRGRSVHRGCL